MASHLPRDSRYRGNDISSTPHHPSVPNPWENRSPLATWLADPIPGMWSIWGVTHTQYDRDMVLDQHSKLRHLRSLRLAMTQPLASHRVKFII